ncbi:acyl-coenzyme A amino acid N-acyltransferase 1-like [Ruditapes philippinarum]|uniref:acyl-coenzyme A amino acid N-acyltransferase 1-like n=1 Tax=Ruditapes philippinarum TaxID=129788 RepID=UPI00295A7869|nr:acyl-coenzyme A amino acid N-acyltransferase 1-like [Ruditapes philippinarum]
MTTKIFVDKEDALVDETVKITVDGLQKNQHVTIRAEVIEKGQIFAGSGCFVANDTGTVDVSTQPSKCGTYKGVSSMGLFWSMQIAPGMPKGIRLIKKNASSPLLTNLTVFSGHFTLKQTYTLNVDQLCSKRINRWYIVKGVQKVKVRSGRIRGTLFLPPGKGPFPCVIDMFGVVGSCIEFRAALLASRGFAAIALPYFLHDDLPVDLGELELEYFMETVDWLYVHPLIDGNNIGVLGVSKGGEIAFHLGLYNDKIKSVVSINGGPFFTSMPMLYKEEYIGQTENRYDKIIVTKEGVDVTETLYCNVEDYVPIWTKDVNVLIISGLDDRCLKSDFLYNLWKRYPSNRKHLCTIYRYPGAGHLIEPPYSPLARSTLGYCPESAIKYLKGFTTDNRTILVLWGGETEAHAHAQEDSWKRILNHFRTTLQTSQKKGDNILDSKL